MITFPRTLEAATAAKGTIRTGGTDLTERRHRGLATGDLIDLRDLSGFDGITVLEDGRTEVGALVNLARFGADPVTAAYGGVTGAAMGLATPQIRARATVSGALLQEVRCWYYRSPEFFCLKRGGATCFARAGEADFHSVLDRGPCIAPHPSTLATALLAYGAKAVVNGQERDIPTLLGDGTDARQTNAVAPGEVLTSVRLPAPIAGEQGAYKRVIHRARAEWPLVECTVRVRLDSAGKIAALSFALGWVANRPVRFPDAELACVGVVPADSAIDDIFRGLVATSPALPQGAYKALLVPVLLRETLDLALAATKVPGPLQPPVAPTAPVEKP